MVCTEVLFCIVRSGSMHKVPAVDATGAGTLMAFHVARRAFLFSSIRVRVWGQTLSRVPWRSFRRHKSQVKSSQAFVRYNSTGGLSARHTSH